MTAVAVDKFGGQSNSSSLSVNVYGPFVAPLSPVNGDTIQNPVTLTYQVIFHYFKHSKKLINNR